MNRKRLFTADTIERLVREEGQTVLVLGQHDILTPLARDRARELGLALVYPDRRDPDLPVWSAAHQASPPPARLAPAASEDLEARVRAAVLKILGESPSTPSPAPEPSSSPPPASWETPATFPVQRSGSPPVCVTCGQPIRQKPEHLTQLDATHFAPKNTPRIRFRGKLDSVQGLIQLVAARARAWRLPDLAQHLDTLAAYCREILSAEYNERPVASLTLAGLDEAAIREATHHPQRVLGVDHLTPGPQDHEIIHWLNYLRTQVREAELAALDAFAPPPLFEPTRPDLIRALNRLSSAVYYLALLYKAGKYPWRSP